MPVPKGPVDHDLGPATSYVTTTGRVRLWSPGAAALFGKDRDEVLGRDLCEAILDGPPPLNNTIRTGARKADLGQGSGARVSPGHNR